MEAQGMNLFSLLPGMPQVVAGNQAVSGTHSAIYSGSKPEFFEVFSQLTTQLYDESVTNIDFELSASDVFDKHCQPVS